MDNLHVYSLFTDLVQEANGQGMGMDERISRAIVSLAALSYKLVEGGDIHNCDARG